MVHYETLPTIPLRSKNITLLTSISPKIMHREDPAISAMIDLVQLPPKTIEKKAAIDTGLNKMKDHGVHWLFVIDKKEQVVGIIATENILGEQPIKIQQERRISRTKITIDMLMEPLDTLPALDINLVNRFKVGNIVNTLSTHHRPYALVIKSHSEQQAICGLFITAYINQQLSLSSSNE